MEQSKPWPCQFSLFQSQQSVEAIKLCSEVLQLEQDNVNALKARAEAYLLEEQYEEGNSW